ncbi:sensor domain-containing phosphodiesterase [Alteribacter natronophilus]|uniref:sensor domain-containing phosphodiesterase n=1 Tax=Alteribacter natronophilus TaxID=2583810 RepID=UPI00110EE7D8|nr:EAL domain-containing protein [Alteribacter natronophilus]TMW72045.1 EAL domain-containing protein [Alteribacter natronophilus]
MNVSDQTRYSRLANITKLINTNLELREMLTHVITAISDEIVQCDSVGIYLPQEDGSFRGFVGKPEVINGMTLDNHVIDMEHDLLAKEVAETGRTIYIPDTSKDTRPDARAVEAFQIKSLLVLPISHNDELFGLVFLFDYGIPMNLNECEIESVKAYVNMAAVAINNAKILKRKETLINQKQLLLDVSRELSMCSSVEEALDICFLYVEKVLGTANVGSHLIDPVAERVMNPARLSRRSDWSEEDWKYVHSKVHINLREDPVMAAVIESKEPLYIPDVCSDPGVNKEACSRFGIKSLLIMPMVAAGKVLGLIPVVELQKNGREFSENRMQLAQSVVDTTAGTVANLLYTEKQDLIIKERTAELQEKNDELNQAVSELKRIRDEKELILNSAGEGIFGLDLKGRITFCNPASAKMLGYDSAEELIGKPYSFIFRRKGVHDEAPLSSEREEYDTEEKFFRKDNTSFPVEYVISSLEKDGKVTGDVVTFKDITRRRQMEEQIKYQAYYDSLTNLPNRVLLNDRLTQGITYSRLHSEKLAVLFLDLDRFKYVNDTHGHSFGDLLLQEVARRLSEAVPDEATVSRQGGDEFTIFLPNIQDKDEVVNVVESINRRFSSPFFVNGHEVYVKNSIGISLYPENGETTDDLVKNADTAMYKSKELSGDNYHFYESDMDNRLYERIQRETALYKALDQNELEVYYQPQVDYRKGRITGVEALLRWNHPVEGMIPPGDFLPIAEDTGLIVPIGEWVIQESCRQLKQWHDFGFTDLDVSVNLTVREFEQADLFTKVKNILSRTGLDPCFLKLEITENQILKDTEGTLARMREFKESGVDISIDDFGTGYSSLAYLKQFPIHTLKIDKSFIQDIDERGENASIVNTIIDLAKNMELDLIAEGVETVEQADFLASKGCCHMQGFYFSRPLPADRIKNKFLSGESLPVSEPQT